MFKQNSDTLLFQPLFWLIWIAKLKIRQFFEQIIRAVCCLFTSHFYIFKTSCLHFPKLLLTFLEPYMSYLYYLSVSLYSGPFAFIFSKLLFASWDKCIGQRRHFQISHPLIYFKLCQNCFVCAGLLSNCFVCAGLLNTYTYTMDVLHFWFRLCECVTYSYACGISRLVFLL